MYIDRIWPFTTFISRNKHKKNIRLRLYWLRLRVAEAEVQTSHDISQQLLIGNLWQHVAVCISLLACSTSHAMFWNDGMRKSIQISVNRYKVAPGFASV